MSWLANNNLSTNKRHYPTSIMSNHIDSSAKNIHIALAFDRNYIIPFFITLTSIFVNKKKSKIIIHAVTSDVKENEKSHIKNYVKDYCSDIFFYNISNYNLENLPIPADTYFTRAIYYRLFIPLIIPKEIEKIIYLDTDTIVISDLEDLYDKETGSFPVGAALDNQMDIRPELGIYSKGAYFNSGVLLIDIKLWKSKNVTEKTVKFLAKNGGEKIRFGDQDALNFILKNNWYLLDQKWNVMRVDIPKLPQKGYELFLKDKIVIHYNDRFKPWQVSCDHKLKYIYDHYSLMFFESNRGRLFVETDMEFELDYIIAKAFKKKHADVETTLLYASVCHLCWIRAMKKVYPVTEGDQILINFYQNSRPDTGSITYDELFIAFENNKILLSKIYSEITETGDIGKMAPIWTQRWLKICSDTVNLKTISNVNIHSFSIPDLIDKKMAISGTNRTLLYFLMGRFLQTLH